VAAVRRGQALRQVARDAGVSLSTVQLWVGRAQHRRLDEVDWADRSSRPRRTSRTPRPLEDLVLQVRQELRDTSDLGEFGAAVIRAELVARDVVGVPSVRTPRFPTRCRVVAFMSDLQVVTHAPNLSFT
jgi:transposase-like protein